MVRLGTQEWLDEYRARINASPVVREAARTFDGVLGYVIEADAEGRWPQTVYALVDLRRGECRAARIVDAVQANTATYLITAPYRLWRQVVTRELDPIKGLLQGKLRLRGDLLGLVRHVRTAQELVRVAAGIPTEFEDADASAPDAGGAAPPR